MSALGERTLLLLLTDTDSVEQLAREGLDLDVVPTQDLRPVVEWSLRHLTQTGRAPTADVLRAQFGDLLSDHEVDLDAEVEEAVEWALDDLRSSYARNEAGKFARRLVTEVTEADPDQRVDVLARFSTELASMTMRLQPRTTQVDLRSSGEDILLAYDEAVATRGTVRGLAFGLPQVDAHTRGVHEGEIAVVGGGPKSGKSWLANFVALQEWRRERVAALFTLENSIEMTQLRLACVALGLSIQELQDGALSAQDYDKLRAWVRDVLEPSPVPLPIFSPVTVARTPHAVVAAARANGADSLVVDQLNFLENGRERRDQRRNYELTDILRDLRDLISTGRRQLPCLLMHQIKREGVEHAEKTGRYRMSDFADSAEVERIASMAFALYASEDMRAIGRMQLQGLAARRFPLKSWDLLWQIEVGLIRVRNEAVLP